MILDFLHNPIGASKFFIWSEALRLNEWGVFVFPESDVVYLNIIETCQKMDLIREFVGKPIFVTSWYRAKKYNEHIKGAKNSYHTTGRACDFIVKGQTPEETRELLIPKLDEFGIRMENLADSTWVHIDTAPVGKSGRFFIP